MDPLIAYGQLIANFSALVVIGWIYAAYVKNLRAGLGLKDEQLATVRANLELWKDKAEQLEKRTPEYLEQLLSERIKIREEELTRLKSDKDQHRQEIQERNVALEKLKYELQKAKDVGNAITVWDHDSDQERVLGPSDLELVQVGEVGVDAACLMICDPSYIKNVWRETDYERPPARLIDTEIGDVYEHWKDFKRYDEPLLKDSMLSINALIEKGRLKKIPDPKQGGPFDFSMSGALYASTTPDRFGSMTYLTGEEGAGVCFSTYYGDGVFPVYGEKFQGRLVRVYVNLL